MGLLTLRPGRPASVCRALATVLAPLLGVAGVPSAEVSLEYQVKATYLFNFVKFVEWPPRPDSRALTICVAERNPFADSLREAVQGEKIGDRRLETRVVSRPESFCDVLFVPRDTAGGRYLEAFRDTPTLTVGEAAEFLTKGGIINFTVERGSVGFEIDSSAAKRAGLRISSHLLRLSRPPAGRG